MNKQAAEKIAQEYYQIGQALALEATGLTKEANLGNILRALKPAAKGTALAGGGLTAMHNAPEIAKFLTQKAPGMEALSNKIVSAPGNTLEYLEKLIGSYPTVV